jgi:TRAP-type C4-dicarboxylate transport system substrate-binding protein
VTITLKAGSANAAIPGTFFGSWYTTELPAIAARVAKETNYRINWITAPGGSVAKPGEELIHVRDGVLDFAPIGTPYETSRIPIFSFSYSWVPFCSTKPSDTVKANAQVFKEMPYFATTLLNDWKQVYLGLGALTNYEVVSTFPIKSLSDLKGKKIGTALGQWFEGTGATAVFSAWPDAYQNMQSHVYDGFLIAPDTANGSKAYEVAPYVTRGLNPLSPVVSVFTFNQVSWNKLPESVRNIIQDEMTKFTESAALAADAGYLDALKKWEAAGGKINDFDPASRAAWAASMPNIPLLRAAEVDAKGAPGTAAVKRFIQLLEQNSGKKCDRNWLG